MVEPIYAVIDAGTTGGHLQQAAAGNGMPPSDERSDGHDAASWRMVTRQRTTRTRTH